MDTERLKITAETTAIRGRGWLRLVVRLLGIGLLLLGATNLLGFGLWTGYRSLWPALAAPSEGVAVYAADFAVACVGAAIAHFT